VSDWRTLSVALRADVANYQRNLNSAASSTDKVGKSWVSTSKLVKAGVAAIGVAAVALVNSSVKYQAAMLNVQSLGTETDASMKRLSASVLDLSTKLPQSAQTLAEGLYDIESSGFAGSAALTVLQASAKAASAGLSDTATSARAITGVLNAYGLGADHAREVSDILFQTVNSGVISFSELAQNLGDVVPMAAAMGISLQQVTGALATMTLAGLPAAEAATATARVMQAFIKPSAGMATEMARLGITLDDLKNPAFGLSGAMQAIAKDTGGSTVALQGMFPDVRSLKGALALTSAEGKTYARVMRDEAKATDGAGATQRAFAVQMQGLGAQLEIAKNKGMAFFLALSVQVIPVVQQLAGEIGDGLVGASKALAPVWDDLFSTGQNVATMLDELADGVGPAAKGFGMLAGGAVVGGLRATASILDDLTGLLARNAALVEMVGGAFLAWKAAQIIGSVVTSLGETIYLYGLTAASSVASATTQVGAITATGVAAQLTAAAIMEMVAPFVLMAAPLAVAAAGFYSFKKASDAAAASVKATNEAAKGKGLDGLANALNDSRTKGLAAIKTLDTYGGTARRTFFGVVQALSPLPDMVQRANQESKKQLAGQYTRMSTEVSRLAYNYGLTTGQVNKYLSSDKDLNLATATTKQVHDSLVKTLGATAKATGLTTTQVKDLSGALASSGMSLDDFAQGMSDAQSKAADAISSFGDLSKHKFDFGEDTKHILNADDIRKFYGDTLTETKTFTDGISALIQQGYDPGLVSRLLQEGPETAGPQVKALVAGYSSDLVGFVNDAEQQISALSQRAAESARLAYVATTSNSDKLTGELSQAQAIVQAKFAGMGSVDIAKKLGMTPEVFDGIVRDFGISVDKIKTVAGSVKPVPIKGDKRDFDKDMGQAMYDVSRLNGTNASPEIRLDLVRLMSDKTFADAILKKLARTRASEIRTHADPLAIHQTDLEIAQLTRARTVTIIAQADTAQAEQQIRQAASTAWMNSAAGMASVQAALAAASGRRYGGVDTFARGGFGRFADGGMGGFADGRRPLWMFGEKSTGGEAFVPRLGISQQRAASILDVAAGWHGMAVTPKAKVAPFTPSGGVTIVLQTGDIKVAVASGSPQAIGPAVDAAMTQWVKRNPSKIVAAVGSHAARIGK
jgi:TP901 family phage tail tape measure protein